MLRVIMTLAMLAVSSVAYAHELTPTYFEFKPSVFKNVSATNFLLFNRREDVTYYEIEVYDVNWNPVKFATSEKLVKIDYLERKNITLYVNNTDMKKVVYVCTTSKLVKGNVTSAGVASRICSKIK